MRLGGLRIDPKTNIGSRVTYTNNVKLKKLDEKGLIFMTISTKIKEETNFRRKIYWSCDDEKIT